MLTSNKRPVFAICVASEGYDDLEIWKAYPIVNDAKAAEVGCIRVIDESGEDYLYPAGRFVAINLPKGALARLPRWQPSSQTRKVARAASKGRRRVSA